MAALQATDYSLGGALDSAWMCLCGALVMFMHAGFGMLETGCCRAKNASNVLMKNLVNVSRKVEGSCRKRSGSERYDFSHKAQWFTTNELVSKSVTGLTSNLAGWLGLWGMISWWGTTCTVLIGSFRLQSQVCVGTLGWWIFGWAFAYGEQNGNGFIGTTGFIGCRPAGNYQ